MKFNRKGKYVAVQAKCTWVTDNFIYYSSDMYGDWIIIEFQHFFKLNKDLLKAYSSTVKPSDTPSSNLLTINTALV